MSNNATRHACDDLDPSRAAGVAAGRHAARDCRRRAVGTYLRARDDANALFDYQLKEMAASLTDAPFAALPPFGEYHRARPRTRWSCRSGTATACSCSCRSRSACCRSMRSWASPRCPTDSGQWRVFSTLAGDQVVQVAQPMSARRELAASLALHTIIPLLAALPFLGVLIWYTIARGLSPLDRVAADVARRSPALLEPLPESNLPREVQPLVHALNGLLAALESSARRATHRSSPTPRTSCARR